MEVVKVSSLGFNDLDYSVPGSVEEFDQLAGKQGACLAEARNNVIYRMSLADFRAGFLHGLHIGEGEGAIDISGVEEITGIERARIVTKKATSAEDEDQWKYDPADSEAVYFKRVCATLAKKNQDEQNGGPVTVEAVMETFRPLAQQVLDAIKFDPKRKERLPSGPKKVAKTYVQAAEKIVNGGKAEVSAQKLSAKLGIPVEPTVESIARAIAEDKRRQKAQEDLAAEYV